MFAENFAPEIFGDSFVQITAGAEFTYRLKANDSNFDQVTVTTNLDTATVTPGNEANIYIITGVITNYSNFRFTVTATVSVYN